MISVVIPTRNPHAVRLERTLAGLGAQPIDRSAWELPVVDNGSALPLTCSAIEAIGGWIVTETATGLSRARLAGTRDTRRRGEVRAFAHLAANKFAKTP